jgi:hypothetical protein
MARTPTRRAIRSLGRVILAGGSLMSTTVHAAADGAVQPPSAGPQASFHEALGAPGPPARGGASDLYSGLIGDWEAEVVDHLPGGATRRQSAEVHFAWVLEGRAIQDLWIAPARRDRAQPLPRAGDGDRYGTTLRVYDPAIDAWRITWWNPAAGVETRLVGRRAGAQILQTGADAEGRLIRWVFVELRDDRFHWRGERSADGGRTWTCDTEYFARRVRAEPVEARRESRAAWAWTDRPGLETLRLLRSDAGTTAEGGVLVVLEPGAPISVRYRIAHDAGWRFREASVEATAQGSSRTLHVHRDANGRWVVDGTPRPDLDGCEEFDLMVTPYTNTPPLAARRLAVGESRALRVAWVEVPALTLRAVDQEYTRLDAGGARAGVARYRYRNQQSGFTAELSVDADGLVVDYGPWVRR